MGFRLDSSHATEITDILIADAALTIGFSLALNGGLLGGESPSNLIYLLPIAFAAVSLSFILHELMHKMVAQRFGAIAAFRRSDMGIIITLATSIFGFLVGLPGATVIYTNTFTKKEMGYVSIAGPLTNFAVFVIFFALALVLHQNIADPTTYLATAFYVIIYIAILLAFFNMLPIYPLDGSKVLAWNKYVYIVTMAVIFFLAYEFISLTLFDMVYLLIFAFVISMFYRGFRL